MTSSTQSRVRRLLGNATWLLGGNSIASLIGFAQAIVLGRALGADGYGLLGVVVVFTTVVNQLVDIRLWETVTKFVGEYHARKMDGHGRAVVKLALAVDFLTGVAAFAVVLVIAPVVSTRLLGRPEAVPLITLYAITLLVATLNQTAMALLRVFDRFRLLGIERVVLHAARFAALVVVLSFSHSLVHVLWTYIVTDFVHAMVLVALALSTAKRTLREPGPDHVGLLRPRLREFLVFTGHNALTMFLSLVSRQLDVLILAAFRGDAQVGYYRMARNFSQLLLRLADPVYQAIYPELVRLREETRRSADMHAFIRETMRRVLTFIVPLVALIELTADWLIELTVGAEFLPAVPVLRIMAIAVLVQAGFLWARPLALTLGRPAVSTAGFAAGAAVLIVSSAALVPTYGSMGSGVAFLLTMVTIAAITAAGALRASRSAQTFGG